MRDHRNWTISLGTWRGVHVGIHLFFLLFAAGVLYLSWFHSQQSQDAALPSLGWACLGLLLVSVLLHEVGHVIAARRLGATVDEIVLWPFGGLSAPASLRDPRADLLVHLAGPLVNLAICGAICFPVLSVQSVEVLGLLNPLQPEKLTDGARWLVFFKLTFWINSGLFVLNLLPAFPFDGGRIFASTMMIVWPGTEQRRASAAVALVAKCLVIAIVGASILMYPHATQTVVPSWFALSLLAIFIYFSARQEEELEEDEPDDEETPFGYDFSQGYTSLERSLDPPHETPPANTLARWLEQRKEVRERRQREIEQDEERRVDEVLARLHEVGWENLSPEERSLLQRVSARYRSRNERST